MLTTVTIIIFLSILILVHELGHFLLAKRFGLFVGEFGLGLPPRAWGKKIGETVYSVNWLPFGGYVKIAGEDGIEDEERQVPRERMFGSVAAWKRFLILVGGVGMNFLLGWALLSIVFMIGLEPGVFVNGVQENSPAAAAGLRPNDRLLDFDRVDNVIAFAKSHAGEQVAVRIMRAGKELSVQITPRTDPPAGQGALGVLLGESIGRGNMGIGDAIKEGLFESIAIVKGTLRGVAALLTAAVMGEGSLEHVSGPIGIVKATADASEAGLVYLLSLMALISINLAVFNILPFPALDGGRVLFLAVEKIKGSPLPKKFEQYANGIGLLLLLGLIAVVSVKDVLRLL